MRLQIILFLIFSLLSPFSSFAKKVNPLEQIDFANGLLARGFYQMAKEEYQAFIDDYPDNQYLDEAYFGLAESFFQVDLYEKAIPEYKKFIKRSANDKEKNTATLRIVEAYLNLGQTDKSLEMLNSLSDVKSQSVKQKVLFYQGKIFQKKGDNSKGLGFLIKAAELPVRSRFKSLSFLEAGKILSAQKNYKKAFSYYQKAFQRANSLQLKNLILFEKGETEFFNQLYQKAISTFKVILDNAEKDKLSQQAFLYLLMSFYNLAEYENIINQYQEKIKLIESYDSAFDIYYIVTLSYQELAEYGKAITIVDKILADSNLSPANLKKAILKKAEIKLESKDYRQAIQLIDNNFGKNNKDNAEAIFIKAEAYYELEKFGIAYQYYEDIVKKFYDSKFRDEAIYSMAYCWHLLGKDKEARDLFLRYFKEGNDLQKREDSLYNLIVAEKKNNLLEKAIEYSNLYLQEFPDGKMKEQILFQLGVFYSDLEKREKAKETFEMFIGDFPKSVRVQKAYFLLAYNLQSLQKNQEALKYYAKVSVDDKDIYYSSLKNIALIHIRQNNFEKAAELFQKIIDESEKNDLSIDTYLWLSQFYLDQKKFKKVLELINQSNSEEKFSNYNLEVFFLKAEAYRELGQCKNAIENYSKIFEEKEKNHSFAAAAHIGKGLCLKKLGDYEQARKELEAVITKFPDDHTAVMRSRYETAGIEKQKGNLEKAAKLYLLVSILYEDKEFVPLALKNAAEIFEKQNEQQKAIKVYNQILDNYPDSQIAEKIKDKLKQLYAN